MITLASYSYSREMPWEWTRSKVYNWCRQKATFIFPQTSAHWQTPQSYNKLIFRRLLAMCGHRRVGPGEHPAQSWHPPTSTYKTCRALTVQTWPCSPQHQPPLNPFWSSEVTSKTSLGGLSDHKRLGTEGASFGLQFGQDSLHHGALGVPARVKGAVNEGAPEGWQQRSCKKRINSRNVKCRK